VLVVFTPKDLKINDFSLIALSKLAGDELTITKIG
jgi:hypothetical protein